MTAEIITVGFEILQGKIVDSNAAHIGRSLLDIGLEVSRIVTIGDRTSEIQTAVREALKRAQVVIMTGGLGPTRDDITKNAVADLFGLPLRRDPTVITRMRERYAQFGYADIPDSAINQADVPRGVTALPNPSGTAPGLQFNRRGRYLFMVPGVPGEMQDILRESIIPFLRDQVSDVHVAMRNIRTTGVGETALADVLDPSVRRWKHVSLAYLPGLKGVDLRLTVRGLPARQATARLRAAEATIRKRVGEWIFGVGDTELAEVVADQLQSTGTTIAIAESCTGGMIASRLTDIPGSSGYFERGVVSYSNAAKQDMLKVPARLLRTHGAVSPEVAAAMAEGIRARAGTDIGLSVTGILGPDGGTPDKPVGLVYGGITDARGTDIWTRQFGTGRTRNKIRVTQMALKVLLDRIRATR